jgi:hypothetical protein
MGVVIEDLWDHEGSAARWLPDGTLTGTRTAATRDVTASLAACSCGWQVELEDPPTEDGEEVALGAWRAEYAGLLLARQGGRGQLELAQMLEWLGRQAGRRHDPTIVARVRGELDCAVDLVADLQRDLGRQAPAREGDGEP